MKKQTLTPTAIACGLIILLVVAFMVRSSLSRPERLVLPAEPDGAGASGAPVTSETIDRVEVQPDTVQSVIAALERPAVYSRDITIERYWSGGSGTSRATVRASGGWMRLDLTTGDGQQRHVISGEGAVYVWYGTSKRYFSGAETMSQDAEQGIPTYEDVLALPTEQIAAADHRALEGVSCIYVETAPDDARYSERYWVSTDTGLLVAAERMHGDEVIYRMASLAASLEPVDAEAFTLPSGAVLYDPAAADAADTDEAEKTEEDS